MMIARLPGGGIVDTHAYMTFATRHFAVRIKVHRTGLQQG